MKKMLIIVDPQNDFCSEGGSLANKECIEAVDRIVKWLPEHIDEYEHIIVTMDSHDDDYLETREGNHLPVIHCIWETDGWKIRKDLFQTIEDYKRLYRTYLFDGVFTSDDGTIKLIAKDEFAANWPYLLHDSIDDTPIDICGVCTDICVIANALSLQKTTNSEINCLSDLCAGTTPENHEAALKVMKSCQINII